MKESSTIECIRNIGIMAHIDAGKTTTTERILFYSGVSTRLGEVHDGASIMDWMVDEQQRGISISSAATSFKWESCGRHHHCNLIDTPGHIDFTMEVERSLRVLDGAVVIFCAVGGVESQSETVWHQADRYHVPRIAFINKCDRIGADPAKVAEEIRTRLNANPIVLQLPHKGFSHEKDEELNGIIDLVKFDSRVWNASSLGQEFEDTEIPDELIVKARFARDLMLEALADVDDSIMEQYLSDEEIAPADIVAALRRATLSMQAVPVVMGAAFKNIGIQNLLDAVVNYLPSPVDVSTAYGYGHAGFGVDADNVSLRESPTAALAFKTVRDVRAGSATYLRVYSGALRSGDQLLNATKNKLEKIGRLVRMHASYRENVRELLAGDIGAAVGLRITTTGDTLCDSLVPTVLGAIPIPDPVVVVIVEPATDVDHDRLLSGLEQIAAEDPSLSVRIDSVTGQVVLGGMGELHLEVVVDRLAREFEVKAYSGRPQVAYRETIRTSGEFCYRLERATPSAQFAGIRLRAEFDSSVPTVTFVDAYDGDLPKAYLSAIQAGILESAETGVIAAFPIMNVRITLLDAEYHPVDSNEISFKIATLRCFLEAVKLAEPRLMEPLMEVEVVAPDEHVGDVVGDLHARRGKIAGIESRLGVQVIACLVPLSKMFGYSTDLRSRTKGRATYSMRISKYQEVPASIAELVVARVKGA